MSSLLSKTPCWSSVQLTVLDFLSRRCRMVYWNTLLACQCCDRKARASAQSFTLWQQATIEITLVVTIRKYSIINCSPGSQALLEVTHQDHSIGITLLLLVRATFAWVLFFAHIPFVVNRTFKATPAERSQHQ